MAEVEALCDRVAILVDGSIRKIGTPSEIVLEVKRETVICVKLDKEPEDIMFDHLQLREKRYGYLYYNTDSPPQGMTELIQYIKDNNYELVDLSISKPTLEERFIEIAKEER